MIDRQAVAAAGVAAQVLVGVPLIIGGWRVAIVSAARTAVGKASTVVYADKLLRDRVAVVHEVPVSGCYGYAYTTDHIAHLASLVIVGNPP